MIEEKESKIIHLGLSHKEIFTLSVLQILDQQVEYGINIFRKIQEGLDGKRVSRSHFYATLEEMIKQGLIQEAPSADKRKKVFAITEEGRKKREWYRDSFLEQFSAIAHLADIFLHDITRTGTKPKVIELTLEHQKFFSKIIYVRRLVEYILLKKLIRQDVIIPSKILDQSLYQYGWQPAKTYFYEVLWDMEKKLWVSGEWEGERRTNRLYRLEPKGQEIFSEIEAAVLHSTRTVRSFVLSVINLLS
ncbi:PadR family transcriptional regulator [Ammoniphilus resinae]|uniref:DNA-binding PadR family transcriptional regulator n=1 Tax=Ammoniphilus resinae TaxID=861532 RepID=A0ABS4GNK7_9BACL|nr:helix-turn-helix transcriptional regulator [Ammoniphilus resinae]MBP1931862.1 DNA-binding PadR family transcriptional regulator [Ammoniphilus resinae]